ncbi:hypothetical protein AAVH_18112 [Aphelenchoides avenae]|nr:hypothetical protein AAVH_18112 [Aphelenchus avenae]
MGVHLASKTLAPVKFTTLAPVCGVNEFFDPCTGCEGDCTNLGLIACAAICISPGRCSCIGGYVRSPNGDCVKPEECPGSSGISTASTSLPPKCPEFEYVNSCGGCDGTCREPSPPCPEICGPAECRCIEGYVRRGGRCIPLEKCRRRKLPPCALVRCGWGQRCVVIRGRAVCVGTHEEEDPCAAVLCPENTRCVVVPITCFVAPCPPGEAMCLPIKESIAEKS